MLLEVVFLRVLRRLQVALVSAAASWFMVGRNRSLLKLARLSHVAALIACSLDWQIWPNCFRSGEMINVWLT